MDKYIKNFILCGDIEHYCLLCQELFKSIPAVEKHIRWEKHRQKLKNQAHFPRFRRDSIYKLATMFYCELCNFVMYNIEAVTEHINIERHKAMKNNPKTEIKNSIAQYDSGYIVINKIILNKAQWNSIIDKKCLICNIKVQNVDEHISIEEHIINLIQSQTNFEDVPYYRKINEDQYHCFNCKKVFTALNFNNHKTSCENIDEIEIKNLKAGFSKSIGTKTEDKAKMEELQKQVINPLLEFYLIDGKKNSATCKYCNSVMAINFKAMLEHMKMHHENQVPSETPQPTADSKPDPVSNKSSKDEVVYVEVIDSGKRRSELAKYGKENSIKLNYNGSKGFCLLCAVYLSAHKNVFKDHINGAIHRGNLEVLGLNPPNKKNEYIFKTKSILKCDVAAYIISEEKFFLINNIYIVDVYSFFLLRQIEDPHFKKTKCFACNELFPQGQERQHCDTPNHKKNFLAARFVDFTEFGDDQEFVREIRANYFHCGFCNKAFPYMEQMANHGLSIAHMMLRLERNKHVFCGHAEFQTKNKDVYNILLHYSYGNI